MFFPFSIIFLIPTKNGQKTYVLFFRFLKFLLYHQKYVKLKSEVKTDLKKQTFKKPHQVQKVQKNSVFKKLKQLHPNKTIDPFPFKLSHP